jgi:hypothetical protein
MFDNLSPVTASAFVSGGVFVISLALIFWLRFERSRRDPDLDEADRLYFSRQDRRRDIGLAVLLILAQGFAIAPGIEFRVQAEPSLIFIVFWLAIFVLVLVLLGIALLDILATRTYAKRHRAAILEERRVLVKQLEQLARKQRNKEETSPADPESSS